MVMGMSENNEKHIIGVYPDLTAEGGPEFATDVLETARYEKLIEEGYQVAGVIDKDSTMEDIEEIAHRLADQMVPPDDDPVWDVMTQIFLDSLTPKQMVRSMLGWNSSGPFLEELAARVAAGEDEDEVCRAKIAEIKERWAQNG